MGRWVPTLEYALKEAVAEERETWRNEIEPYLIAAADGSMSRNNSEQLAAELLEWIKRRAGL
jgi:Holliday junction resolvasome RuvABC ATP-dependent DNA helicase subunit